MRTPIRVSPALALVALVAPFLLTDYARAEEADAAKELAARIVELRKIGDAAGLMEALGQTPDVYRSTKNAGLRSKLRSEMGKVVRDERLGNTRVAAVDALVALDDAKGAWKELAKAMPKPKVEEATAFDLAMVKAAGRLAPSRGASTLLDLVESAKDNKLGAAAAVALGGYRKDKRNRVKILEDMISLGKRLRPGTAPDKPVSLEARKRWAVLGPGIRVGLNTLTGQLLATFEEWEALHKEHRKRPKELFLADD